MSDTSSLLPTIRYAAPGDAVAIARLYQYTTRIAYRGYVPDVILDGRSLDDITRLWAAKISKAPGREQRILVADPPHRPVESGEIAGFVAIGAASSSAESSDTGELHYIFVAPQQWGHGLGRRLIDRATELFREDGYRQAILWVFSENKRARSFYEVAGWHHDGFERPDPAFADFPNPPLEMRYRIVFGE